MYTLEDKALQMRDLWDLTVYAMLYSMDLNKIQFSKFCLTTILCI